MYLSIKSKCKLYKLFSGEVVNGRRILVVIWIIVWIQDFYRIGVISHYGGVTNKPTDLQLNVLWSRMLTPSKLYTNCTVSKIQWSADMWERLFGLVCLLTIELKKNKKLLHRFRWNFQDRLALGKVRTLFFMKNLGNTVYINTNPQPPILFWWPRRLNITKTRGWEHGLAWQAGKIFWFSCFALQVLFKWMS